MDTKGFYSGVCSQRNLGSFCMVGTHDRTRSVGPFVQGCQASLSRLWIICIVLGCEEEKEANKKSV